MNSLLPQIPKLNPAGLHKAYRRAMHGAVILIAAIILSSPASSQAVETDLSEKDVPIEWNFTGTKILLFGAVDGNSKRGGVKKSDVIIVVRGPTENLLARQKQRIAGVWVNTLSRPYEDVPGYYSIVSSRPITKIANAKVLQQHGIGFQALERRLTKRNGEVKKGKPNPYSQAVVRIFKKEGLYSEKPSGVRLIGNSLFRANISLPANVPVGQFYADVYLFKNGQLISMTSQSLNIQKQGFERLVYSLAFDYPLLYGIVAVILAVLAGLAASALFRKE